MPRERDDDHADQKSAKSRARSATRKPRLTKDDWTAAALEALHDGGLAAVAIEPLAARLGTTKGSAYWHFENRNALVAATLARWESAHTERLIELIESEPDASRKLRRLFATVLQYASTGGVELSLLAAAEDPQVGPVLRRVTERRISYLARLFADAGFGRAEAGRRAVIAYSTYLGHAQLARTAPGQLPLGKTAFRNYIDDAVDTLLTKKH